MIAASGSAATAPTAEPLSTRAESVALVLAVADDPAADAGRMAQAIGTDPALAARVLAMANSSYYGLRGHVVGLDVAVSILGLSTIRAITLMTAAASHGAVPEGFWTQAALCATAGNLLARTFDVRPADAFCLGLLHTLGSALLNHRAPLTALCLPEPDALDEFLDREVDRYGTDHAVAGADALAAWDFAPHLCHVVGDHHSEPLPGSVPLAKTLYTARACAHTVLTGETPEHFLGGVERVSSGRIGVDELSQVARHAHDKARALIDMLQQFT